MVKLKNNYYKETFENLKPSSSSYSYLTLYEKVNPDPALFVTVRLTIVFYKSL